MSQMAGRLERAKAKRALREDHRRFVVTGMRVDQGDRLGCGRTWIMSQRMLDHLDCRSIISRGPGIGTRSSRQIEFPSAHERVFHAVFIVHERNRESFR